MRKSSSGRDVQSARFRRFPFHPPVPTLSPGRSSIDDKMIEGRRGVALPLSGERARSTGDVGKSRSAAALGEERSVTFDESSYHKPGLVVRNLSYCARVKCGEGEASSAASDKHRSLERSKTFARGVGEANDRRKGSSNMGVM